MVKREEEPLAGIAEVKQRIKDEISSRRDELTELSLRIHKNPELGYKEVKASAWLTQYLDENGFSVVRGVCELPTAFRAKYGEVGPIIAILAEYDALPNAGHACGHNLIAGSAVGAGVASKIAVDLFGGSVLVIGTPAEELGGRGGKIIMVDKGAFDDVEAAMMVHPTWMDVASANNSALESLKVEFFGKEAHAGVMPSAGINALEAMIQSFNAINALRQRLKNQGSIHGIITDGGTAANIIPAHSAATFMVRAEDDNLLDELKQRVLNCFIGAATASDTRLEYTWEGRMASMCYNVTLARLFSENMQTLGHNMRFVKRRSTASSDVGNVSRRVPTIQALAKAAPAGTIGHSPEMAKAAASEMGIKEMLNAAAGMAMTVVDLLARPVILTKIKEEFRRKCQESHRPAQIASLNNDRQTRKMGLNKSPNV